jgi:hypothetical protein
MTRDSKPGKEAVDATPRHFSHQSSLPLYHPSSFPIPIIPIDLHYLRLAAIPSMSRPASRSFGVVVLLRLPMLVLGEMGEGLLQVGLLERLVLLHVEVGFIKHSA